ncbi:MAG: DUF6341 family protein [Flavobacteriaceae bacterium]|tara:strand:+ start:1669 stop:1899 length:231 start_codon:yes stop_codon:yes gene_type:complete
MWKNFFESIAFLFEEILLVPFNFLREMQLDSWWLANIVSWIFLFSGIVASIFWIRQLKIFDDKGEENKDISSHSFL